jgi:hypothetical protein
MERTSPLGERISALDKVEATMRRRLVSKESDRYG